MMHVISYVHSCLVSVHIKKLEDLVLLRGRAIMASDSFIVVHSNIV